MLLHQCIRVRRTVRDHVLSLEKIGFVPVVDASEITDAIDEGCAHADVDALVRWQKVRGQHDRRAYRISTRSQLYDELTRFHTHCF